MKRATMNRCLAAAVFVLTCLAPTPVRGQELEYALELGAMGGGCFYLGDANYHSLYQNTKFAGGLMGRYNMNPRQSLKFDIAVGQISGNALLEKNKFPEIPGQQWKFDETLVDVGCQYELGFWGYGMGTGYKNSRRLAPYIQVGLGTTVCNGAFTLNLPVGVGVRYKLRERWNVGLDWTMRFSLSDRLDGIEDPYAIKSGFLKNKDSYSFTMLYISYDLCPKYRKCNNE